MKYLFSVVFDTLVPLVCVFFLVTGTFFDEKYKLIVFAIALIVIYLVLLNMFLLLRNLTFSDIYRLLYKVFTNKVLRYDYNKEEAYIALNKIYKVYLTKFSAFSLFILATASIILIALESYYNKVYIFRVAEFIIPYERILLGIWLVWIFIFSNVNSHFRDEILIKEMNNKPT